MKCYRSSIRREVLFRVMEVVVRVCAAVLVANGAASNSRAQTGGEVTAQVNVPVTSLPVVVLRRDLRPLSGAAVRLTGAANATVTTDPAGRATFVNVPTTGGLTLTPTRSGFRFTPPQVVLANAAAAREVAFTALPVSTDLELSILTDLDTPMVGQIVRGTLAVRNRGTESATDVFVRFSSMPGLLAEDVQVSGGTLDFDGFSRVWHLREIPAGQIAEARIRARATLPNANVLAGAVIEDMEQADTNPINNTAVLITPTRSAQARLTLAMAINPSTIKAGETAELRLTLRNDGPNDATQVALRNYLPPGATFAPAAPDPLDLGDTTVVPRLAAGTQVQLSGRIRVRIPGMFTHIANALRFEEQLPVGAPWPEARANFTVQPAAARLTLQAFTDPPNPRVGDYVNVTYVTKNEGPDAVTGVKHFTREDTRLSSPGPSDANRLPPPVPGPFVFGEVLPVGAYTYFSFRYLVKGAGDLTNYFTVEYQDQLIANGADHPELFVPIRTLPADVALSLDVRPKEFTVAAGERVTVDFLVHNDGPHAARPVGIDFVPDGLAAAAPEEIVRGNVTTPARIFGSIDEVGPGETVILRRHFVGVRAGLYTNTAEIKVSLQRPELEMPIAAERVRWRVLAGPPPNLALGLTVDPPQVNVGEYALYIVTITNRAAEPAFNIRVEETNPADVNLAKETVRSFGPLGDIRGAEDTVRVIPRLEPGGVYAMSRTMRFRRPGVIPHVARITSVNGLIDTEFPRLAASAPVTGVQVSADVEALLFADRTAVKSGDLVNFALIARNPSARVVSHVNFVAGVGAGFQVMGTDLGSYGYRFDPLRPRDLLSGAGQLPDWIEIRPQQSAISFAATYTFAPGALVAATQLSGLDQLDATPGNNLAGLQINSTPASARISLRQSVLPTTASVGEFVLFVTEVRNEGPDRATGLQLVITNAPNLSRTLSAGVNGISGEFRESAFDNFTRLPALEPGQNFVLQRTYRATALGNGWQRVRVTDVDQTPVAPLPQSEVAANVQNANADVQLEWLAAPTALQVNVPAAFALRVRNAGPAAATDVVVGVTGADSLLLGRFEFGPRAGYRVPGEGEFQTTLLPGESATAVFFVTPQAVGRFAGTVHVVQLDQIDPRPENNILSLTLDVGPEPPIPPPLRVLRVRTDFFDRTPIAEVEVNHGALTRAFPRTSFRLEGGSNLRDWQLLSFAGAPFLGRGVVTDHARPGETSRFYRLNRF